MSTITTQPDGPAGTALADGERGRVEALTIIGSGPAGWTAALYAARANLNPLVFPGRASSGVLPGGQLMGTTDVENYPGFPKGIMGPEMMEQFFHQAMRFGTRVVTDDGPRTIEELDTPTLFQPFQSVQSVDLSTRPFTVRGDTGETFLTHALIIATGAQANWLGLPNELRLAQSGGGVTACAVCDGALPIFRGQEVCVIGGGDSAIEEATYLTKFAKRVYLIHRRDELRATQIMQQRAMENRKIEVLWNSQVVDVLGQEKIEAVQLEDTVTGERRKLSVKGMFLAIGHTPITKFLDGQLPTDNKGYLQLADEARSTTAVEGVFAAGDVADSTYRQAITAAGMGCKSAMDAERWLTHEGLLDHSVPQAGWKE